MAYTLTELASIYARLRDARDALDRDYEGKRKVLRTGMEAIEELVRPELEKVKDDHDKAILRTEFGSFNLSLAGRMEITNNGVFVRSLLSGYVPMSVVGKELKSGPLLEYVERRKVEVGYANLSPEQKSTFDLNICMPPGTKWSPFERVQFRKGKAKQ